MIRRATFYGGSPKSAFANPGEAASSGTGTYVVYSIPEGDRASLSKTLSSAVACRRWSCASRNASRIRVIVRSSTNRARLMVPMIGSRINMRVPKPVPAKSSCSVCRRSIRSDSAPATSVALGASRSYSRLVRRLPSAMVANAPAMISTLCSSELVPALHFWRAAKTRMASDGSVPRLGSSKPRHRAQRFINRIASARPAVLSIADRIHFVIARPCSSSSRLPQTTSNEISFTTNFTMGIRAFEMTCMSLAAGHWSSMRWRTVSQSSRAQFRSTSDDAIAKPCAFEPNNST